jgi:hypothetical protein
MNVWDGQVAGLSATATVAVGDVGWAVVAGAARAHAVASNKRVLMICNDRCH